MKRTWKRQWVKLWIEILDDAKMGKLPDWLWRRAIELFLLAGENENDGLLQPVTDLAWRLRTSETKLTESLAALSLVGVVHETPEGWCVTNFKKRQWSESLDRVRRYRNGYGNEHVTGDVAGINDDNDSLSLSLSYSPSISVSEEGGMGGETKTKPVERGDCFVAKNAPRNDMVMGRETEGDRGRTPPQPSPPFWNRDYHANLKNDLERERSENAQKTPAEEEFIDHFGSFNGKRERQRWETLVEAIGCARAQEIAAWAERKEIHLVNRGGLMDSLETAAKKWTDKPTRRKPTPEERQAQVMENIRKGLEMAEVSDGKF